MIVALAILSQIVLFGIYYYLDAKMITAKSDAEMWRFALNPLTVLFYGGSIGISWWSYRVINKALDQRFWLTVMVSGVILYIVHVIVSYLATRIAPTPQEWVALALSLAAVLVAAL